MGTEVALSLLREWFAPEVCPFEGGAVKIERLDDQGQTVWAIEAEIQALRWFGDREALRQGGEVENRMIELTLHGARLSEAQPNADITDLMAPNMFRHIDLNDVAITRPDDDIVVIQNRRYRWMFAPPRR